MAYTTTTLAILQARLAERFEARPFWSSEESRLAINESLRIFNGLTGFWRQRVTLTTVPNDPWLPLPGTIVQRTRLEIGGIALQRSSLAQLQYSRDHWQSETTASGAPVPTSVTVWAAAGLSLVALWPASTVIQNILVDGIAITPVLVNPGDFIDLGDEEFSQLLGFALHILTFKGPDEGFAATTSLRIGFYKGAAEKNERFATSDFLRQFVGQEKERSQNWRSRPTLPTEAPGTAGS